MGRMTDSAPPTAQRAHLVVVIPTHGRPDLLGRTLASVAACARPAGYGGCLVVENGPRAGAEAVVAGAARAHPGAGFRYLHHGRANKSAALNAALAGVPDGALCVFFDDDVRVEPDVLLRYEAIGERTGPGTFMGGSVRCDYDMPPPDWLVPLLPLSARGLDLAGADANALYLGFNWAAYAGDIREAGGFDPNYGPGAPTNATGQESNMEGRLLLLGCRMVNVSSAVVHHHVPVERCSPLWAAGRQHRDAIGWGRVARVRDRPLPFIITNAWLTTKCCLVAARKYASGDRVGRWKAIKQAGYHSGLIRGFLQPRRPVEIRTATARKPKIGEPGRLGEDEVLAMWQGRPAASA